MHIQSPLKESIHLRQSQVLKIEGARGKVGGAPHPPLSWSEFQNEAWPSLDQLNDGFGAPPTFHLVSLSFEYSARQKCILSFGGDCSSC